MDVSELEHLRVAEEKKQKRQAAIERFQNMLSTKRAIREQTKQLIDTKIEEHRIHKEQREKSLSEPRPRLKTEQSTGFAMVLPVSDAMKPKPKPVLSSAVYNEKKAIQKQAGRSI